MAGRMLKYAELKPLKGIQFSREHLRQMELGHRFPRRVQLSANSVAWDETEIDAWLEAKREARGEGPAPSTSDVRRRPRRRA